MWIGSSPSIYEKKSEFEFFFFLNSNFLQIIRTIHIPDPYIYLYFDFIWIENNLNIYEKINRNHSRKKK